jgi:hypothetical protein
VVHRLLLLFGELSPQTTACLQNEEVLTVLYSDFMLLSVGASTQIIKDPETEARELQSVLKSVGERLRANTAKTGKLGITYTEFKARKRGASRTDNSLK